MNNKYDDLIAFIPVIRDDKFGKWIIDRENDGTPEHPIHFPFVSYSQAVMELEQVIYKFVDNNPDFGLNHYGSILEENGIKRDLKEMQNADVSEMNAQSVMALLVGAIRAERFCDGALLHFLETRSVLRWLERLQEIISE